MAQKIPLAFVKSVDGATRVMEHSWRNSPFCERALTPVVNQKRTCLCYALTCAEATRAVINLKGDKDIPRLSAEEIFNNCHHVFCLGYHSSVALEWIYREGLVEDSAEELNLDFGSVYVPPKGKLIGTRQPISEWEPMLNCDADIKSSVLRQPVIVSLNYADILTSNYDGGLIDAYIMSKEQATFHHSMLLTGFGYYIFPDNSIVDFWEIKNSFGEKSGYDGYLHVIRNSSQPVEKWVSFDPLVPLVLAPGERYDKENHLVKSLSFDQLDEVVKDPDLDLIILFYEGRKVTPETSYIMDFKRCSRLYIPDKSDVKLIQVDVNDTEGNIQRSRLKKYQIREGRSKRTSPFKKFPCIRTYKYLEKKKIAQFRNLNSGHKLELPVKQEVPILDFQDIARFLIGKAGGPSWTQDELPKDELPRDD